MGKKQADCHLRGSKSGGFAVTGSPPDLISRRIGRRSWLTSGRQPKETLSFFLPTFFLTENAWNSLFLICTLKDMYVLTRCKDIIARIQG